MSGALNHHTIDLAPIKGLARFDIEVWDDTPRNGLPPHVTFYWDCADLTSVDLTPNEARALAALLVIAADSQDRDAPKAA